MSGISSKALNFGSPDNKKKKFQGQEYNDDLGVDMYEFKYRMDDPQIGRFWQIDPLADKYVYNSTYAFSENKVTGHVELEGLEAKLAIAGSSTDFVNYTQDQIDVMKLRAINLSQEGYTPKQVNNGVQILDVLKNATKEEGSIQSAVFFSHGTGDGIMLNHNDGFYTENKSYGGENSANVSNLKYSIDHGDIKFEKNSAIVVGACNCAKPGKLSDVSFGESIAKNTGVTTYAATNYINLMNGKNTGKLSTGGTFIKFESVTTVIPIETNKKQQIYPPVVINEIRKTDVGKVLDLKKIQ